MIGGNRLGGTGGAQEPTRINVANRLGPQTLGKGRSLAQAKLREGRVKLPLVAVNAIPLALTVANDNQSHGMPFLRLGGLVARLGIIAEGMRWVDNRLRFAEARWSGHIPHLVYNRLAMERQIKHHSEVAGKPIPYQRMDYRVGKLITSFHYAFQGVWYMLRTQRNAQIHTLVGAVAVALATVLRLERWEWIALLLTITLVLAAEGVNTAVEATVDLITTTRHPLAKVAKDVAAGTVLLCAIASVILGGVIFLPHLWPVLTGLLGR